MSAGPCANCGQPGEWQHGLSWLCDPCDVTAHLDDVAEHRRAEGEDIDGEERGERFAAWSEGP